MENMKVTVIGAGTMGAGIAQAAAEAGHEVMLADVSPDLAEKAKQKIAGYLRRRVEKNELTAGDADAVLARIQPSAGLDGAASAGIVIEAIVEDPRKKREVFTTLNRLCPAGAILATNTSALSISDLASVVTNPARVVGIHFFNPVAKMKLVEVIKGKTTSDETVHAALAFARRLNKTPVLVNESPGFIVNRLLIPMINEAVCALADGVADREAIDAAMKLGAGHPMGPLELADLIGLDICLHIMEIFEEEMGRVKYAPCPLLREMVQKGQLGRKTGRGFYEYPAR